MATRLALLLIALLGSASFAAGPKYVYPESPKLNDEIENIYNDIRDVPNGTYTASSMTLLGLTVTSITVTSLSGVTLGKIRQVVSTTAQTNATTNSTTFVDTSLSLSITPSSTSSKIFVVATGTLYNAAAAGSAFATVLRGSTNLLSADGGCRVFAGSSDALSPCTLTFLDSPSTTSATTYKVQVRSSTAANSVVWGSNNTLTQVITLFEVGP